MKLHVALNGSENKRQKTWWIKFYFIILFIYFHWCNDNRAWQSVREH